mgnify:CR=1 FL=1
MVWTHSHILCFCNYIWSHTKVYNTSKFIEDDFIEAVILFPGNCFYNTPAPGVIIIINRDKKKKDKVLLINASKLYKKGRPKNYLPEETIEKV